MKKKLSLVMAGLLACSTLAGLTACDEYFKLPKPGDYDDADAEMEEISSVVIDTIQEKYDARYEDAEKDPFAGAEDLVAELSMSHWDSEGAAIETTVVNAVLAGFSKRYPNVTVDLEVINDYETSYAYRIVSDEVHDVFMVPDGQFQAWAGSTMENLNSRINQSVLLNLDDIYPSVVSRYNKNGRQYALPKDISAHVMYYNKDIFDTLRVAYPPSDRIMTIDEAKTMWKSLTTGSYYGMAGMEMEGLVWSGGGDFLNASRTGYDSGSTAAITQAYRFIQEAYFGPSGNGEGAFMDQTAASSGVTLANMFSQQRVATFIGGSWNVSTFRGCGFDWDIAHVPAFSTRPTKNGWSGSVGYAVKSSLSGNKKEAAWKLVEYISSEEGQEILAATGFQFPLYKSIGLDDDYLDAQAMQKPESYHVFIEAASEQPAGTWTYRAGNQWRDQSYNELSQFLLDSNAGQRWSVSRFVSEVQTKLGTLL